MAAPELSAVAVSKYFGGVCAVDKVTFTVRKGEIVSLIGPNGAGKTSLLNLISGFFRPDSGAILLGELNITRRRPSEIARLGVARTFQNIALFTGLTVLDNILLGRHVHMRASLVASLVFLGPARDEQMRIARALRKSSNFLNSTTCGSNPSVHFLTDCANGWNWGVR